MRAFLTFAIVLFLSFGLFACGYRERVSYTYTKQNMTQQAMLDDEKSVEKLDGVQKVMSKIDDRNTVRLEVIVDEKKETAALQYLLDQGYSQVRN